MIKDTEELGYDRVRKNIVKQRTLFCVSWMLRQVDRMDNQEMERIRDEIIQIILGFVESESSLIFLFGSMATHTGKAHSDFDVGYLGLHSLSDGTISEIRDSLNEKVQTLRQIDFVDFTKVCDVVFRNEVSEGAVEWYRGKDCAIKLSCLNV